MCSKIKTVLGYNDGQILDLFKKTLPTRYYYLLFSIQNLKEAIESAKHVMTQEKMDKQVADQNSNPYISLKTHLSEKHKSVKFDKNKSLDNNLTV